jgi:glutamate N-acetyltransferase/amino-acid N-acetyltransferase
MAVGKCSQYADIHPDRTRIAIGGLEVFPPASDVTVAQLQRYMTSTGEVAIVVDLHAGNARATAWGCDLSCEYVRFNSSYTT